MKIIILLADITSILSNKQDSERIEMIKNIKLETSFYNAFRNTIRILLGHIDHRIIRKDIENIINQKYLLYQTKMVEIDAKLKDLTQNAINFIIYNKSLDDKITNITTCLVNNADTCQKEDYCLLSQGNKCKLLIPKMNLITKKDNEVEYYGKITDELIRYNRIKHFIFEPQAFLSFSTLKYNLNENELLIIQSFLNQDYFSDIIIAHDTKYIKNSSYDTANPKVYSSICCYII